MANPRSNPRYVVWSLVPAALLALLAPAAGHSADDPQTQPADGLVASPEADWPQWRGPRRDGHSPETGLLQTWPESGPRLLWKIDGLGKGWSSPIVVGGRLFITGDVDDALVVSAYDLDGQRLWRATNGQAWLGSYPGARATCAFSAERVYHLNAHGRLACLDAASGRELWSVRVLERFGAENITWALSECLLVDGDRVIVTPGGSRGLIAALDKNDGKIVWATPQPSDEDRATHSSPILFRFGGRRLIATCSSSHGFGVDAESGRLLWTVPLKNQFGVNAATPTYGSGQLFYVTPYAEDGRAYHLRPAADGDLAAELNWTSSLDTVTGSALLVGEVLYAAGYRKSKWWMGLDWSTGEVVAEQKALSTGAAICADGRLYVLDERGNVGMLRLAGGGSSGASSAPAESLAVAGRFTLVTGRVRDAWAHPVLLDGRLYLRYHDSLWCYDVKNP